MYVLAITTSLLYADVLRTVWSLANELQCGGEQRLQCFSFVLRYDHNAVYKETFTTDGNKTANFSLPKMVCYHDYASRY